MTMELVGTREAGLILGVTSERVRQLHKAGRFAEPLGYVGRSPIWTRESVEDFCLSIGRAPIEITTDARGVVQQVRGQQVLPELDSG